MINAIQVRTIFTGKCWCLGGDFLFASGGDGLILWAHENCFGGSQPVTGFIGNIFPFNSH